MHCYHVFITLNKSQLTLGCIGDYSSLRLCFYITPCIFGWLLVFYSETSTVNIKVLLSVCGINSFILVSSFCTDAQQSYRQIFIIIIFVQVCHKHFEHFEFAPITYMLDNCMQQRRKLILGNIGTAFTSLTEIEVTGTDWIKEETIYCGYNKKIMTQNNS